MAHSCAATDPSSPDRVKEPRSAFRARRFEMVEAVSGRPHKERDRAKCKGGERQFAGFSQHRQEGRGCGLPGSVYPVAPRYDGSFGATRSRSKKTLRAAEQERADVARA